MHLDLAAKLVRRLDELDGRACVHAEAVAILTSRVAAI
jgi:hypothetical protein